MTVTNSNKKIMLGAIGAAAIGGAIYMLLSTERGSEFKKKIADSVNDIACRIGEYFTSAKEEVQSV